MEPTAELDAWYRDHATHLLRLAVLACGDRAAAEDVVHDAFIRCVSARPGPAPGMERAYLRRAVLNLSSNVHRWERRHRDDRLPVAAHGEPAEGAAVRADTAERVVTAVRGLPVRQRDCVLLRYFAGLSDAEVAETLGVSAGSVKTHLHRARSTLREILEDLR